MARLVFRGFGLASLTCLEARGMGQPGLPVVITKTKNKTQSLCFCSPPDGQMHTRWQNFSCRMQLTFGIRLRCGDSDPTFTASCCNPEDGYGKTYVEIAQSHFSLILSLFRERNSDMDGSRDSGLASAANGATSFDVETVPPKQKYQKLPRLIVTASVCKILGVNMYRPMRNSNNACINRLPRVGPPRPCREHGIALLFLLPSALRTA